MIKLEKKIWLRWKSGKNTAEIATELNIPEHEVDRIKSRLRERFLRTGDG